MRALPLAVPLIALAACTTRAPAGPTTEAGVLERGDLTLQSGEYFDAFAVTASGGQWITVEVTARDFDPYLIIRSPSGEQSDIDDSEHGNTTTTRSILRASEAGQWDILVTSYAPGESGAYSVTYEVSDERPADALDTVLGADSTIAV